MQNYSDRVPAMSYKIGDIVVYGSGEQELRRVRVTAKHRNIKNGHPGFDGECITPICGAMGIAVWGYDAQILEVIP